MLRRTVRPRPGLAHRLDARRAGPRAPGSAAGPPAARARTRSARGGRGCSGRRARGRRSGSRPARRSSTGPGATSCEPTFSALPVRTSTDGCGPSSARKRRIRASSGAQLVEDPLRRRGGRAPRRDVGRAAQQLGAAVAQRAASVPRSLRPSPSGPRSRGGGGASPVLRAALLEVDDAEQRRAWSRSSAPALLRAARGRLAAERPPGSPRPSAACRTRPPSSRRCASRGAHGDARTLGAASAGGARLARRLAGVSALVAHHAEDRQVDEAGAEAEHGAVEEEQPLVLLHRRAQHLGEVRGRQLAHAGADQRADRARSGARLNSGSVSGVIV